MPVAPEPRPRRTTRRRRWARTALAGLVLATCASGPLVAPAAPASAVDHPSWDDVRAAQGDAAATQRQVDAVEGALDELEASAAERGREAVTAGAAAAEAQAGLDAATRERDRLDAEADRAAEHAAASRRTAGQLSGELFRTGGTRSLGTGLVGSADAGDTLYRLGALTQLGDRWQGVLADAEAATGTAASLRDQAGRAATALEDAAEEAERTSTAASEAQRAADADVATAQADGAELYEQLAALKRTSADVEQQYRQGVAADRAYAEQQAAAAARAAAPTAGGAPGSSSGSRPAPPVAGGGTVVAPPVAAPPVAAPPVAAPPVTAPAPAPVAPPAPVVEDPTGAKAYAQGVLAARGQGADQYSCLVQLWNRESGWRTGATNPSSGAYGIPQALPGSKMASSGLDWRTNPRTQVDWGVGYISSVYGTPCAAWDHSNRKGWY